MRNRILRLAAALAFFRNDNGMAPYSRAKQGIGYVPEGREIFRLLTVNENPVMRP